MIYLHNIYKGFFMVEKLSKEAKKTAIIAGMFVGGNANELGKTYNVNPVTIGSWMREEAKKSDKDEVIALKEVDPIALEVMANEVKRKASDNPNITTKQLIDLEKSIDKVVTGAIGLKLLEAEFHLTIMNLLKVANNKIDNDMKISEWTALVNGINTLHTSLFKISSSTNIQMLQQNNGGGVSSAKVEKFKGGFRL